MQQRKKVRGPSPARRKGSTPQDLMDNSQRLTLTMSVEDMENLQKLSDANLRSMSAQALFYLRAAMLKELESQLPKSQSPPA